MCRTHKRKGILKQQTINYQRRLKMKNPNTKPSQNQRATTERNQETRIQRYKEITKEKVGLQPTRQLCGITAHAGVLFCRP